MAENNARLDPQATTDPQETIDAEIAQIEGDYRAGLAADPANSSTEHFNAE